MIGELLWLVYSLLLIDWPQFWPITWISVSGSSFIFGVSADPQFLAFCVPGSLVPSIAVRYIRTHDRSIYISGWWFGTWFLFFPSYWECHHPNWRTPSFFRRGRYTTNQRSSSEKCGFHAEKCWILPARMVIQLRNVGIEPVLRQKK